MPPTTESPRVDCIESVTNSPDQRKRDDAASELSIAMGEGHLYGPGSMRIRRAPKAVVRVATSVVGVTLCSLALSSCGGSGGAKGVPSTTSARAVGTSTTGVADGQILSAWLAAQQAFHEAALTSDPSSPGLTATMISPQLEGVESALARLRAAGDVGRGPMTYGLPRITDAGSSSASVVSCIHDQEIEVQVTTGVPVSGILGEPDFELVTSTMLSTGGGWKLASQTVEVGQCNGS